MLIIPSLLESNINNLDFQIKRLSPYFNRFQIDIVDGIYVPNKTVTTKEALELLGIKSYELGGIVFDFHLMVKDYETDLQLLQNNKDKMNIGYILIHSSLSPNYSLLTTKHSLPIGLVINPGSNIDTLASNYSLSAIPVIQLMTVQPGFQGSTFIPESLNKIEQLKIAGYRNKIMLDGGINSQTIKIIYSLKYLPDIICPGSFIVKSSDIRSAIKQLTPMQ